MMGGLKKTQFGKVGLSTAFSFVLIAVFLFIGWTIWQNFSNQPYMTVNDRRISLEVVDTPAAMSQGLAGRDRLAPDSGMLFVYEKPSLPKFWMKDMLIPIDIVWMDKNKKVVGVEHRLQPDSYPETYRPNELVIYVLEIAAGDARRYGIKNGDSVEINL